MIDLEIAECTEKTITLSFKSTDTTLINPILDILNKDPDVKLARYVSIHPELEKPQLVVSMEDSSIKTAKDAIVDAAGTVSEYFSTVNHTMGDWYVPHPISHSSNSSQYAGIQDSEYKDKDTSSNHKNSNSSPKADGYGADGQ